MFVCDTIVMVILTKPHYAGGNFNMDGNNFDPQFGNGVPVQDNNTVQPDPFAAQNNYGAPQSDPFASQNNYGTPVQDPYGNYGQPPYGAPQGPEPGKGAAIGSLVCGIISIVFWFFGLGAIVGIILGIVGLILASASKKQGFVGGLRTGGFVCSLIGLIVSAIILVSCIAVTACTAAALGASGISGSDILEGLEDIEDLQNLEGLF